MFEVPTASNAMGNKRPGSPTAVTLTSAQLRSGNTRPPPNSLSLHLHIRLVQPLALEVRVALQYVQYYSKLLGIPNLKKEPLLVSTKFLRPSFPGSA